MLDLRSVSLSTVVQEQYFSGKQLERWFIEFAKSETIFYRPPVSLKQLVKKLDSDLNRRLGDCREFLEDKFVEGNAWIDQILFTNQEPNIHKSLKQDLFDHLLDHVVAADAIVEVQTKTGETIRIAVDVTADPEEEETKVQKVKGLPDKRDSPGKNKNRNIPKIRKWLGIDKHLVLILNNQESLLPSRGKLLDELQAFAESNTITSDINLKSLAPSETLAGAAQQSSTRAFQTFLSGYLDAAVRSVIANLENTETETTQPDGSVVKEPVIAIREDGTKSFESGSFSWNLMPDNSVSITRLKDGSQVTPESANAGEMNAIKNFVVECHRKFLKNRQTPENDDDPPSQKQKTRKPKV